MEGWEEEDGVGREEEEEERRESSMLQRRRGSAFVSCWGGRRACVPVWGREGGKEGRRGEEKDE